MTARHTADKTIENMRPYKVFAIKEGVVIDHIPARKAFKVVEVLGLNKDMGDSILTMGVYLESKKSGRKDVIKIENKELTKEETDKIALIAPRATINIIRDHKVIGKREIETPDRFDRLIRCPNTKCITNHQPVDTIFTTESKEPLSVKCFFCEKTFSRDEITLM